MDNMKKPNFKVNTIAMAVGLSVDSQRSLAEERESLEKLKATTTSIIELLVEEGVLSKNKAEAMMQSASEEGKRKAKRIAAQKKKEAAGKVPPKDGAVRVQYVPEHVKKKLREEIKQEVMATAKEEGWAAPNQIPDWTNRIAFNGDMRLRYEHDSF